MPIHTSARVLFSVLRHIPFGGSGMMTADTKKHEARSIKQFPTLFQGRVCSRFLKEGRLKAPIQNREIVIILTYLFIFIYSCLYLFIICVLCYMCVHVLKCLYICMCWSIRTYVPMEARG